MKVEVPINMKFVEGAKSYADKGIFQAGSMEHFRKASAVSPGHYLSFRRSEQRRIQ